MDFGAKNPYQGWSPRQIAFHIADLQGKDTRGAALATVPPHLQNLVKAHVKAIFIKRKAMNNARKKP